MQLSGLAEPEVEQLIQRSASVSPPSGLSATIHRRTEGNPLFVTEIIRMLPSEGMEGSQEFLTSIPDGVRDAIGRRLNQLSEGCNWVLATVSVIGREFDFKLLNALRDDLTEASLLEWVEEALAAHVIEELPQGRERYQFSHALIQETLSEELSTSRKVRLHACIAEALEELYGVETDDHASELAHHFAEAETALGPEKLVQYSLLAGERALETYAYEEARAHFERALVAKGVALTGSVPARDADEAALLFGLGRAAAATAERRRLQDVVDILERAFEYYEREGDTALAVAVAEYRLPSTNLGRTAVSRYLPRALKLAPPTSLSAGRLLSSYGAEIGRIDNDYEGAQEAFARALAIAEKGKDLSLELNTLLASANVDFYHLHTQEALKKAENAIQLASRIGDHQAAWAAHRDAYRCLAMTGDSSGAERHASIGLELAEKQRARYQLAQSLEMNAQTRRLRGDWQGAWDFVDRGLTVAPADESLLNSRTLLGYEVGDFVNGDADRQRYLEILNSAFSRHGAAPTHAALAIVYMARITGVSSQLAIGKTVAQELVSSPLANPFFVLSARATLGELSVLQNDTTASAEHYAILDGARGSLITLYISADRLLGLLAQTMRKLDQAVVHFEDALVFCRQAGYRPELAWTCHDYADTLLERNSISDREKTTSLLHESLAISTELGMRPLMERVVALQERAASQPARTPAFPDGLTQREVEVLRLISSGKTNQQIGEELFISFNTVGHHVSNILSKTGSANRTEVATYAARHGLTQ